MASFNKVIIAGHLTRDPDVRYLPNGTAVCDFSVAVNRKWYDQQSNITKEEVSFVDLTVFGKQAENIQQYQSKGGNVLVEGRLKQETWNDKQTGQARSKLKVIAEGVTYLGSKSNNSGGGGQSSQSEGSNGYRGGENPSSDPDQDVPF